MFTDTSGLQECRADNREREREREKELGNAEDVL